jgi:hypothetical protein
VSNAPREQSSPLESNFTPNIRQIPFLGELYEFCLLASLEVSKINNVPLAQGQSTARHSTKEPNSLKQGPVMTKALLSTHGARLAPAL